MILNFMRELNASNKIKKEQLQEQNQEQSQEQQQEQSLEQSQEQKSYNILNDLQLRIECMHIFSNLENHHRMYTIDVIRTNRELLEYYKLMPYIYPDWLNMSANINNTNIKKNIIYNAIGYFMMTHTIDEKYREIPYLKKSIDKLFYRGIWHLATNTNFTNFTKKSINKLLKFFDGFCILSRKQTKEEFANTYKEKYKYIANISEDINIKVPYEIYDKYSTMNYLDIFKKIYNTYQYKTMSNYVDSYIFFYNLSDIFIPIDV